MKLVQTLVKALLLVFTAILPLKLTQGIGTPSFPAVYSGDFFSIIYNAWSPYVVVCLEAILLLLSLLLKPDPQAEPVRKKRLTTFFLILFALTLISFTGAINASCTEYVRQTIVWLFGLTCFAGAIRNLLIHDRTMADKLLAALLIGTLIAAAEGWQQTFSGTEHMEEYLRRNNLTDKVSDALLRELHSTRIRGTFTICNIYAGFLASVLAWLGFFCFARFKEKNNRFPWFMRHEILCIFALFLLVPVWETGSRGALLALAIGVFSAASVFAFQSRKGKLLLCIAGALAVAGLCLLVIFRRGAGSITFRLDYFQAALKMMISHPFAGTGWGDFFHEYPRLKILINDETPHSCHNFLLACGSQCGIPGFLAALALMLYPLTVGFRTLYRKIRTNDPTALPFAAILVGCTAFFADALFEMSATSCGFACAALLFSILVLNDPTHEKSSPVQEKIQWIPLLMLLIGAVTLFFSVTEMKREAAYSDLFLAVRPLYSSTPMNRVTPEEIARLAEKAMQTAPDHPFVYAAAGFGAEQQGDLVRAEALYSRTIELAPEDASLYRRRYLVRLHGGFPQESIRNDLEKTRSLEPNRP